jgi:hypothetical protein
VIRMPSRFFYWKLRMKDRLRSLYWSRRALLLRWLGRCEECATKKDVRRIPAMTAYHWDGQGEDPNRDLSFCLEHAEAYRDYWQSMWDDYNSSRL